MFVIVDWPVRPMTRSSRREQARLLIDNLPVAKDDLDNGAVVALGEKTMRIRRLPI
jgi:hypothetical protein